MNGYRYDPHTHTAETSHCGHLYAADVVDRYLSLIHISEPTRPY